MLAVVNISERMSEIPNWACEGEDVEVTVSSANMTESTATRFGMNTEHYYVKIILGKFTVEPGQAQILVKTGDIEKIMTFEGLLTNVSTFYYINFTCYLGENLFCCQTKCDHFQDFGHLRSYNRRVNFRKV